MSTATVGPRRRATVTALAAVVTGVVASAGEFDRIYSGRVVTLLCGVVALTIAAATYAARSHGASLVLASQVTTATFVLCTVTAVQHARRGVTEQLMTGIVDGPLRSLTISLPVEPLMTNAAFVLMLVSVATAAAGLIVVRSASWGAVALPMLLLHGVGVLYGVGAGGNAYLPTVVVTAVILVVARLGGSRRTAEAGVGHAQAVALGSVCLLVAVAVAPRVPGLAERSPYNLRHRLDLPRGTAVALNPLATARAWLSSDQATVVFVLRSPERVDVRVGALDAYDGHGWSVDSVPEPFDRELVRPIGAGQAGGDAYDVVLSTRRVPAPLLPVPDGAVAIDSSVPLRWDEEGGLLVAEDDVRDVDYTVRTVPRARPKGDPRRLSVPRGRDLRRYLAAPRLPDPMTALVPRSGSPAERARTLTTMLGDGTRYRVSKRPPLPPGYSLDTLTTLLTVPHAEGGRVGTPDQFAAAFAVLARSAGVPTRVVVGFRGVGGGGRDVAVRTSEVDVWPEVLLDRVGWVPFDPIPPSGRGRLPKGDQPPPTPPPSAEAAQAADDWRPPSGGDKQTADADHPTRSIPRWAWPLAVLAAYVATVVGVPPVRLRRRRTRGPVPFRVEQAWEHACAALRRQGVHVVSAMTPREVAAAARVEGAAVDAARVAALAGYVETVRYVVTAATDDVAEAAWREADAVVRDVSSRRPRALRLIAALSPRRVAAPAGIPNAAAPAPRGLLRDR